ncbi:MAG TPA: alpha/beta hydrolase [Saprospiraceae bacterium]|nr:alpha/beta hydrolase [Saprospiraceae bacterium]
MRLSCIFAFILFVIALQNLPAQGYCSGDTVIFTEPAHPVDFDDVVYKTAPQIDEWNFEVPENIRLRVYFPTDLPAGERRPLIVLVHGGYFIWGSYLDFDTFAKSLAEQGFIAATVGYRLCKRGDCVIGASLNLPCQISWGNSMQPSAYVAAVDVNDGIRWLQQRAGDYHIDPEKVVVGGHSAGAYTALNVAFLDQSEIQQVMPSAGVSGKYLGEPLDPVVGIRACIPMSGAFLNLDWIEPEEVIGENIAVGVVHGTSDGIVDYDEGVAIPCCQTYNTIVHGGCDVAKRIKALGGNYYLLTGKGFGHDIGEPLFYDALSVQIPAFVIKTVLCGQNIEKHSVVERATPLPVCPGNNPDLAAAPLCDVESVTPPITTPVKEAFGAQVNEALSLLVYPTLTTGQAQVNALAPEANGIWQITVSGMDGRIVQQLRLELNGSAVFELGDAPKGMYNLFFQSLKDGKSGVVRVMKE